MSEFRKDEEHEQLWPAHDDIFSKRIHVSFHKMCRANYTSKSNYSYMFKQKENEDSTCKPSAITTPQRSSRENTSKYDIRRDCFICAKVYKKGEKLTQVTEATAQRTRERVLNSATERLDDDVRLQMFSTH